MSLPNTKKGAKEIGTLLEGKKKLWFIGIGGVHMAAMARYAAGQGFLVAGSDRTAGERTRQLSALGIPIFFGHDAARVVGYDAVVYTLALSPDNPEYIAAMHLGIPLFSRADFLSFLMGRHKNRVGIAGSHGKSTVTAMLAEILTAAGRSPTVFCGAPLRHLEETALQGQGADAVFEACEYQDSFLCFSPTLAVLLNVDWDHVDYFSSLRQIQASFAAFAALPGEGGTVLYNAEDENALACARSSPARCVTFGIEKGDFHTKSCGLNGGCGVFSPVLQNGTVLPEIALRVPGRHNVSNAMAAVAAASLLGVVGDAICTGLSVFGGAGRRMEYRGMFRGARLYDDYAHHPNEIIATLRTARELVGGGRLFAVFQSHTYSRTATFFGEICAALRLADRVLIAPIYAARETETRGMSPSALAIGVGGIAVAPGDLSAIADTLKRELAIGDLVVVMGAGDVDRIFREFSGKHFTL